MIEFDGPVIADICVDEKENVFRPFYRIDKSRNQNNINSGLGLSITRSLLLQINDIILKFLFKCYPANREWVAGNQLQRFDYLLFSNFQIGPLPFKFMGKYHRFALLANNVF